MRMLADSETGLRYRWSAADSIESKTASVSRSQAKQLADDLENRIELSIETVTITGRLEEAGDRLGGWWIADNNGEHHHGRSEDPSKLEGLTIGKLLRVRVHRVH